MRSNRRVTVLFNSSDMRRRRLIRHHLKIGRVLFSPRPTIYGKRPLIRRHQKKNRKCIVLSASYHIWETTLDTTPCKNRKGIVLSASYHIWETTFETTPCKNRKGIVLSASYHIWKTTLGSCSKNTWLRVFQYQERTWYIWTHPEDPPRTESSAYKTSTKRNIKPIVREGVR